MTAKRKSFVIHIDSLDVLDDLTDEQAGKLFKAIKSHQTGDEFEMDSLTKIAFSPFKNQFARDEEKYNAIVERNKNNGLKGGRPKKQENPEKPTGLNGNPDEPKKADSDSKSDSKNKSDSDSKENKDLNTSCSLPSKAGDCPHKEIVDAYHESLPSLTRMRSWNGDRPKNLRARWREDAERQSVDWWKSLFVYISKSDFLMGRVQQQGDRGIFQASLDWIIKPTNFNKIIEGRYHK